MVRFAQHHLSIAVALLGAGAGCDRADATREVVVYVSVDQPTATSVLRAFEEKSGIRVLEVFDVESSKTTGLVHRIEAERATPRADVFWSSEVVQTVWLGERGVLEAYRPPSAEDVPDSLRASDGSWTGTGLRARVLLVNSERVPPAAEPRTLADLVAPRWQPGEVGIGLPLFGTSCTHAAALYTKLGEERARGWYQALRDGGARVVDGNSVVRDLVASGDLAVGLTDNDDAAGAVQRGFPVRIVVPEGPGALYIPGTVALIAGGPHPVEGRALVDWLAGPDAEEMLLDSGFLLGSVRAPPPEMDTDWAEVAAHFPAVQTDLREVFLR